MNFSFLLFFSIVIPIIINGAGRDWWTKKKSIYGIFFISMPNNNNGQSSGLIFGFLDFWPVLIEQPLASPGSANYSKFQFFAPHFK